jgi:RNA polymerase sigma-70 factor (ECF subfamily)
VFGRSGSRDAGEFEQVALVHLDVLYHVALRLTRNRAEAEEIVQETCLRAFRGFSRFNPGTNCRAWLLTILRNVFLNRLRAQGREVLQAEMDQLDVSEGVAEPRRGGGNPEEELLQSVLHGDVDRAVQGLPLPFREAIVLVDLEGLSYREAADVLGCPIGTVMSRLSRGRTQLRQSLKRYAREHGYVKEDE